jgi:hypothetical protein
MKSRSRYFFGVFKTTLVCHPIPYWVGDTGQALCGKYLFCMVLNLVKGEFKN